MRREDCRCCSSKNLLKFLDLGLMPLAGGFLANKEAIAKEQKFQLDTSVCQECGLVQITEIVDPEIMFQDYSFSSSTIAPLVKHFEDYAQWLQTNVQPASVLEFGCNDGVLLAPLTKLGVKAVGIDPSGNITELGRSRGNDIITGYFGEPTAEDIVAKYGTFDVVTGSNVFAHNNEPGKILKAAKKVLQPKGHLCLEVMYAGDLLETYQWDTLYHEHLTFYSLSSLSNLLNRHGFKVVDATRIPMHGGSLRVVATQNQDAEVRAGAREVLAYEAKVKITDPEVWNSFGLFSRKKIDIATEVYGALSKSKRIWAYGAAGKATMWVNACKMSYLEAVVDASPLRAGKLMAGTHTPIVFPDDMKKSPPDHIFVTAWNYADHIKAKEGWFNGIWSVPLPDLRFF
jgi:SAM-dependent methyltransferase